MDAAKLKKAVQEQIDRFPKVWTHSICAFAIINKKTGRLHRSSSATGAPCHGSLLYIEPTTVVINGHKAKWKEVNREFMQWIAEESPFCKGILNRKDESFYNNASAIDTEVVGKGGVLWICKALRHFQEEPHVIKTWSVLREGGLNGLQAFIGADILNSEGSPKYSNTHCSLFCYKSPKEIRKFYDDSTSADVLDSTSVNKGGYSYDYSNSAASFNWGSLKGKKERKSDGWGGFIEKMVPGNPKEYIAALKEIFEGDPNNVK